jgi:uncharacterized protein YbjT (DUF2867 family)
MLEHGKGVFSTQARTQGFHVWNVFQHEGGIDMMQHDKKILVLGATGKQGGAVARHLLARGFTNVHALVRTAESPNTRLLSEQGITLAIGDLDESATLQAAMHDAYGVFAVLPLDQFGPEVEIRRGKSVAEAAKSAQVQHFIYSSVAGADRSEGVADLHAKYVIEQHIRALGLPTSVVRPAALMENLLTFELPRLVDGVAVFRIAIHPESRRQMIAVEDIGMIVADLFARPDHSIGQTLAIAGDELTGLQMADIYTKVTGQPARYEEQPIEEVRVFSPDAAAIYAWQNEHSFGVDLVHLRTVYPKLSTFEAWLDQHRLAVMPQEAGVWA